MTPQEHPLLEMRDISKTQRDSQGDILGLQYGLSDAVTQNYFTKLGYDFDDEKQLDRKSVV